MLRQDKERIIAELTERLRRTQTLIAADYRGLTMKEIDALRTELLGHGARFTVVKNSLARRAAKAAGTDALLALLEGPTAIAFLEADGDPVAVARALNDAARATRVLSLRGGILDGRPITEDDARSLATLPPIDVLRSQVLGAVTAPLVTVVGLFAAPLSDLVGLLDARVEQLAESAPADSAKEEVVEESGAPEASAAEGADETDVAGSADAEPAETEEEE